MDRMPFPMQRIQTDRGQEFFAYEVQERIMEYGIKFRPIKPAFSHLNGKVERSQRTDLDEFYSSIDIKILTL
jgi:transposase InsO family protein